MTAATARRMTRADRRVSAQGDPQTHPRCLWPGGSPGRRSPKAIIGWALTTRQHAAHP